MPVIPVQSLDDPRLAPYRNLKERELAREGDRFIAEGENLVKRLLVSRLKTESVLIADRHVAELSPLVPADIPLFVAPAASDQAALPGDASGCLIRTASLFATSC